MSGQGRDGLTIPRYLNVLKKMQNALNELMLTCREPPPGGIAIISTPVSNYRYPYCDYQHPRCDPHCRHCDYPYRHCDEERVAIDLLRAAAAQLRYRVHAAP